MIDRNCDVTILAGASDERLAMKVLDHARRTRERFHIRPTDFDLGALLHHDLPFLASIAGARMSPAEREGNPHLLSGASPNRSIVESSRHVMRSVAYSVGMPDNCLVSDPSKGNGAAILIDRVARLGRIPRIDEDGPTDAVAAHLVANSVRAGRAMSTEWSPGWDAGPDTDVRKFTDKLFSLDDRQLSAELLEQARDARTRLGVSDGTAPHQTTLWQTIPAMAALFGARLESGEGHRFHHAVRDMDDQQAFELASTLVDASGGGNGLLDRSGLTIGDRALFVDPAQGSTTAVLLDRAALALGAERGGPADPVGRRVSAGRTLPMSVEDFAWRPSEIAVARPVLGMAAHAHAVGMSR